MTSEIQNQESHFFDYYDFLGIPPAAPPNLIYLAILKIEKSLKNNVVKFINYLESKNIIVNLRKSRGEDINAACGQLVNKLN